MQQFFAGDADTNTIQQEQEQQAAAAAAQERTAKAQAIELEQVNATLRSSMAKLSEQVDVGAFLAETLGEIVRQMNAANGFILAVDGDTQMARLHLFHNGKTARWGMSGEEILLLAVPFSIDVTPAFEIMCRTHQPFVASRFTLPIPIEQFALPGGLEYMSQNGISDSAIITLRAGERVIGTMHLQFVGGSVLREEDEPLFVAMSQQAAIAMRLTELAEEAKQAAVVREQEKAAQERAAELAKANDTMRRAVDRLAVESDLDGFLGFLLYEIATQLGTDTAVITPYDRETNTLRAGALFHDGEVTSLEAMPAALSIPNAQFMDRLLHAEGFALFDVDADAELFWPGAVEYLRQRGMRVSVSFAIIADRQFFGQISLAYPSVPTFSLAQTGLVQALSTQAALAIQLTRLAEEVKQAAVVRERERTAQERAVELAKANKALQRSVSQLAGMQDVSHYIDKVLLSSIEQVQASGGALFTFNANEDAIQMQSCVLNGALADIRSDPRLQIWRAPYPTTTFQEGWHTMLSTPEGYFVAKVEPQVPGMAPGVAAWHIAMGNHSVANFPLLRGDEVVGFIGLTFNAPFSLTPEKCELVRSLAQQATLALELTRLAEESKRAAITKEQEKAAQERAAELAKSNEELKREVLERQRAEQVSRGQTEAMMQALNVLAAETDLSAFLSHVMCAIATQLHTQMCALYFYDCKTDLISLHMTYHYGQTLQGDEQAGNPSAGNPHLADKDGFWATHVKTRQPVIVTDISSDPFFYQFTWLTLHGIQSLFSVPLVLGEEVIGYLVVRSKERHDYAPEEIELAQALAHQITLAVNTTRLAEVAKQAAIVREQEKATQERAVELARINHALTLEVEERQRAELLAQGQLQALNHTLQTFAHEPELDRFLGYVLRALTEQLGEQSGTIWLYDPQWEATVLHTELHDGQLQHFPTPAPKDIARRWDREFLPHLRSGQVLIHTESDFATHAAYFPYQQYFAERGIRTILNIPLVAGENFLGIFAVRSKILRGYTPWELELAQALAYQAVLAIQITRLAEGAKQTAAVKAERAVLEERNRLAQEIHDTLAHNFTSIKFLLEAAELTGELPTAPAEIIAQARGMAGEGAKEARRSVWALRPEALERGNLLSALSTVIQQRTRETTLHVELRVEGELFTLRPEVEDNLLRVSQEALANIVKHAQATQARVTLTFAVPEITLCMADDGCGFDPQIKPKGTGLGLIGMRERIARLGGELSIVSATGAGTEIRASIPQAERS